MRRHMLLAALWVAFGLVWLPFAAEAQLPRLGFLANHSPSSSQGSGALINPAVLLITTRINNKKAFFLLGLFDHCDV